MEMVLGLLGYFEQIEYPIKCAFQGIWEFNELNFEHLTNFVPTKVLPNPDIGIQIMTTICWAFLRLYFFNAVYSSFYVEFYYCK